MGKSYSQRMSMTPKQFTMKIGTRILFHPIVFILLLTLVNFTKQEAEYQMERSAVDLATLNATDVCPFFITRKDSEDKSLPGISEVNLAEMLNEDGTINMNSARVGSINMAGFTMGTKPDGTPLFLEEGNMDPNDNWIPFAGVSGMNNLVRALAL